ncbi:protoglobin domain-containing protein [Persephonella sp. KM09-Lau-8]|uniref:protoglobin domain-containing protein n=1 Tax=Persephonella sp. KM09-Lau-8 TaxID=1158345 RepID=UPI000495BF4A|nr:protoglobin domain-containing protein [Persephonella sp. KM09-Lau-8]
MESFEQIKRDFDFTEKDVQNILILKPVMEKYKDEFIDRFYKFISRFPETFKYLKSEEIINRHQEKLREWYDDLFSGKYDYKYFQKLYRIGEKHVDIGLPTHYVNASFNFIRRFFIEKINQEFGLSEKRNQLVASIGKLLDINLDVLTAAYREQELSRYQVMSKFEKVLFTTAKKFSDMLDFALVGALILVSLFVVGLFLYDIYQLVFGIVPIDKGILMALGTLLVLWAVSELMQEEIKHLKGGGFAIGAFIGVALAALIRKILIVSLSVEKSLQLLSYGAIVLSLGIVYWLLSKRK